MAALLFLSRVFPPETFGKFQAYSSVLALLLVVACLRYEIAILRTNGQRAFCAVLAVCILINVLIAFLVFIVCVAACNWLLVERQLDGFLLWALPLSVLFGGLHQMLGYCSLKERDYARVSISKVTQVASYSSSAALFGSVGFTSGGLVIADILGRAVSAISFVTYRLRRMLAAIKRLHAKDLRRAISHYREFPMFAVPGGLVNTAGAVITPILFLSSFEPATAGQFALVDRALAVPVAMLGTAMAQVFTAELSAKLRDDLDGARAFFRQIVAMMFKIGVVPAVVVALVAPTVVPVVFGQQWTLAGEFARIMCPLFLATFVTAPVNMAIMLLGNQRVQIAWEIFRLVMIVAVWTLVIQANLSPYVAVAMHMGSCVISYATYLFLADRLLARQVKIG